jgi:hypothetical protein
MITRNDLLPQALAKFASVGAAFEPVKLFGISDTQDQKEDVINDMLCFISPDQRNLYVSTGTTDPGIHAYVSHPNGAGHLCIGFHPKIWVIDTHAANIPSFAHEALCQRPERGCGTIRFWRDKLRHYIFDPLTDQMEFDTKENPTCCNMHRMSKMHDETHIGLYGEMCQVRQHAGDHEEMMTMIKTFPQVAQTKYNINGVEKWAYLFSYLLTNKSEWEGL